MSKPSRINPIAPSIAQSFIHSADVGSFFYGGVLMQKEADEFAECAYKKSNLAERLIEKFTSEFNEMVADAESQEGNIYFITPFCDPVFKPDYCKFVTDRFDGKTPVKVSFHYDESYEHWKYEFEIAYKRRITQK